MENQHRQIKGYRELTQEEIDLMNEIKQHGVALGELAKKINTYVEAQQRREAVENGDSSELQRLREAEPEKWALLGKTRLQEGLMALTRSIAQPTFF